MDALPPAMSEEEAAASLHEALRVGMTLAARGVEMMDNCEPLPRGLITAGESCRLVAAVITLALHAHPRLLDEDVFAHALEAFITGTATGAVN